MRKPLLLAALTLGVATLIVLGLRWRAAGNACAPLRILFIGNSYTYTHDMPSMLAELADESRPRRRCLAIESIAVGGARLADHWAAGKALRRIRAERWDYVVLQEQSLTPLLAPAAFRGAASQFDAEIRKAGATTLLFVTWARKRAPQDQQTLTDAYYAIARERGATVAPAGVAWHALRAAHAEIELYDPDESHPAPAGAYLTACVFYATLFRASPLGLPAPDGVAAEHAPLIQQAAWDAVSPLIKR